VLTTDLLIDWRAVPTFGTPDDCLPLVVRPSAYAIVSDSVGNVAVVRTPSGVYLLGGGCARGESADETVRREAIEECGITVEPDAWRRFAIEHVAVPREATSFEKRSTFCVAALVAANGMAVEPDHVLAWLARFDALETLTPKSHRWAVSEWLADNVANARF